jgi:NAD(P)-dependent dehydrogenase (short-subunit alcohol dehydrogenase family)
MMTKGYHVILACRDKEKAEAAVSDLKKETGTDSTEFMQCDLASLVSVRHFAEDIKKRKLNLKVLINNAGVQVQEFLTSTEGLELSFATNHVGHFLLTNLLLDDLKKNAPSRVVVVASSMHIPGTAGAPPPDFKWTVDDLNSKENFDGMVAYVNSKLANVWFTYELARKLEGSKVTVNCICPGFCPRTNLFRSHTAFKRFLFRNVFYHFPFCHTESYGGRVIVHAATDPALEGVTSKFLMDFKEMKSSEDSYDIEKAAKLWKWSEELCQLNC